MPKTALVISGGGSKGAFAVGALRYIQEAVRPISKFDLYCGTSTGSLIAPLALCGELDLLEQQYTTLQQNDVVRLGAAARLLTDVSLHDATPLKNKIYELLTDERYARISKAAGLCLATVCLQTEQLVYWTTQATLPATGAYATERIASALDLRRAMLASACQPVFMQPIEIRPGAVPVRQYADGGVREITPLQAAVDGGADTIIAITLGPARTPADNIPFTSAIQILQRTLDLFGEDVSASDYQVTRLYQQVNLAVGAVRASLLQQGVAAGTVNQAFAPLAAALAGKPVVTIHEIRPLEKLVEAGPGGLTFDPASMRAMRDKGYARAKAYFESLPGGVA